MKIVALLLCLIITKHYGISMRLVENNNNANNDENMCSSNTMSSTITTSSNAAAKTGTDATPKDHKDYLRNKINHQLQMVNRLVPNQHLKILSMTGYHDLGEFSNKRHLCHKLCTR